MTEPTAEEIRELAERNEVTVTSMQHQQENGMNIEEFVNTALETADANVRHHEIVKVGDIIPQGDIYLRAIGSVDDREALARAIHQVRGWEDFKLGPLGPVTTNRQLVNDTTQGSRHIVEGDVTIHAPSADAHPLEGPCIIAHDRFMVKHPQHGWHSAPGDLVYQVTYQRDLAQERAARVQD